MTSIPASPGSVHVGLSRVEAGDDGPAMRDIQEGLDVVDWIGFGATGRLPNGAAQLRFALAEVRRIRSERVVLAPGTEGVPRRR